ncbi:hypothetical protein C3L33_23082, partial [Rhododendron williamsianum]
MFYKSNPFMEGEDPVSVIREGLAKALLFYYPFAGRLVEGPNRKLLVDCTSEGVLFVEADAEVELNQLGDAILPGCPMLEELLHDVPGSEGILGCPLLCGGFAIALCLNHTMSDGAGLVQFLSAIAEFAQGKEVTAPSVSPVSLGFDTWDFGWGKLVYGGTAGVFPIANFYMSFKDGTVVPMCCYCHGFYLLEK